MEYEGKTYVLKLTTKEYETGKVEIDLNDPESVKLYDQKIAKTVSRVSSTSREVNLDRPTTETAHDTADLSVGEMAVGVKDTMDTDEYLTRGEYEEQAGKPYVFEQSAFHGSPHRNIEKMLLEKIGTGEGYQVYGWGIYSGKARKTGEQYRINLSEHQDIRKEKYNSKTVSEWRQCWNERIEQKLSKGTPLVDENLKSMHALTKMLRSLEDSRDYGEVINEAKELGYEEKVIDWFQNTFKGKMEVPGQLYRLEIPESDELLDWDKPLSEQPERVKAIIESLTTPEVTRYVDELQYNLKSLRLHGNSAEVPATGEIFYNALSMASGSEKAASLTLREAGIPGLQYLDQLSRNNGEGTHNFVVWDEDRISVEETFYQSAGTNAKTADRLKQDSRPNAVTELMGDFVSMMSFFETANVSSPFHEFAHHALNIYDKLSYINGVEEWMKQDFETVLKEFGYTKEQFRGDEEIARDVH